MEPLAPATGQARAHDALHHEASRDVLQLLGDILAEPLETAAAIGASLARRQNRLFARQMLRQGAALRLSLRSGQRGRERLCSPRDLFVLQSELELVQGLRGGAETLPAQTRKLVLELLDRKIAVTELGVPRRQFGPRGEHHRLQSGDIVGQGSGFVEHGGTLAEKAAKGKPEKPSTYC